MSDVWYHVKPYVLTVGGGLTAISGGWFGVIAGAFAFAVGLMVFHMRGVI